MFRLNQNQVWAFCILLNFALLFLFLRPLFDFLFSLLSLHGLICLIYPDRKKESIYYKVAIVVENFIKGKFEPKNKLRKVMYSATILHCFFHAFPLIAIPRRNVR